MEALCDTCAVPIYLRRRRLLHLQSRAGTAAATLDCMQDWAIQPSVARKFDRPEFFHPRNMTAYLNAIMGRRAVWSRECAISIDNFYAMRQSTK